MGRRMARPHWLWQAAFWALVVLTAALSWTPVEHLPQRVFDLWDKAQHALGFAALAFSGLSAYPRRPLRLALALLVYGVLIEMVQSATGWRHGDVADWLADAVGVALGAAAWVAACRWFRPISAADRPRTP